jgi:hypothetical protein
MQRRWKSLALGALIGPMALASAAFAGASGAAQSCSQGFFWDYTPGHKVGVCVEAKQPLTGASFLSHPSRPL